MLICHWSTHFGIQYCASMFLCSAPHDDEMQPKFIFLLEN